MASSFSTLLLASLLSLMKYVPYVPLALKLKTMKSKAKAKGKPKITEPNLSEASNPKYNREWANIDDFLTSLLVSRSLDPGLPAPILANIYCLMEAVQVENDAAGENSIDDTQSSGGPQEYQDDDLDTASMRAFSRENTEGIFPEQDEPYDDVGIRNRPSVTQVLDHTLKPASEDSRSAKRQSAQPQAESLPTSPVCILTSTTTSPPQARESYRSPLRVSNNPNAGNVDSSGKDNSANTSELSQSDLLDLQNGSDGEHHKAVTDTELLHSSRQSISPSEQRDSNQDFSLDSERGEDKSDDSDSEVRESDKDKRRRSPSRTSLKPQGRSTMPTTTSRQLTSSPSRCQSGPKTDITTRSGSPRTSSPGTMAVYDSSINYGPSDNMAYQLTDITLCQVPKGSLIVTAIVRCNDMMSKSSPNPLALERNFLGDKGQVIRMTQVSPDSWLLLGYRYDDGSALNPRTRQSLTHRSADRKSSRHSKAANHDAVHPDNNGDEEDENGDKDTSNDNPYATGGDMRLNKGNHRNTSSRYKAPTPPKHLAIGNVQWHE
ncbi:hypothetical protein K469DRAFT_686662 [Zopfia rhizophila CBS 207.26]|uniref:Uncharacterized protein n=1 Tax=Zopfia rhizophila CBS 207.26 TaxID=1314779 RepID=A0A6A6ER77_9PEZI|nr:hypothetical protein K469DRAFT_686662 [Zopfia rhizophila CBS 207.26]